MQNRKARQTDGLNMDRPFCLGQAHFFMRVADRNQKDCRCLDRSLYGFVDPRLGPFGAHDGHFRGSALGQSLLEQKSRARTGGLKKAERACNGVNTLGICEVMREASPPSRGGGPLRKRLSIKLRWYWACHIHKAVGPWSARVSC